MREIQTNERGQPQARVERAIENALTNAVGRGDIRPDQVDAKREMLRGYAAALVREDTVSERQYADYAARTGIPGYTPSGYMRSLGC